MILGQVFSLAFLTFDEQRVFGNYRWGTGFSLILLSLLLFGCLGSLDFDMWLAVWILGVLTVTTSLNLKPHLAFKRVRAHLNS